MKTLYSKPTPSCRLTRRPVEKRIRLGFLTRVRYAPGHHICQPVRKVVGQNQEALFIQKLILSHFSFDAAEQFRARRSIGLYLTLNQKVIANLFVITVRFTATAN